jgi:hypothetical protein
MEAEVTEPGKGGRLEIFLLLESLSSKTAALPSPLPTQPGPLSLALGLESWCQPVSSPASFLKALFGTKQTPTLDP